LLSLSSPPHMSPGDRKGDGYVENLGNLDWPLSPPSFRRKIAVLSEKLSYALSGCLLRTTLARNWPYDFSCNRNRSARMSVSWIGILRPLLPSPYSSVPSKPHLSNPRRAPNYVSWLDLVSPYPELPRVPPLFGETRFRKPLVFFFLRCGGLMLYSPLGRLAPPALPLVATPSIYL